MTDETVNNFYFLFTLKGINKLGEVKIKSITENTISPKDIDIRILNKFNIVKETENAINNIIKNTLPDDFRRVVSECIESDINVTTVFDENYPLNLRNIYDPPPYLYYKGRLSDKDRYSIGIVGTRYPSDYGRYTCQKITAELSSLNIPVISGMAMGIDYTAHRKCLDLGNLTYAILGCGVNVVYPKSSTVIYDGIIEKGGAVISEFDINAKPDKTNFPRRNRIISGISLGTVIIESGIKGGSLITAEYAIDQNRELFAVPGNINSIRSEGCNELIKKNFAKLVTNSDDIITELKYRIPEEYFISKSEKKQGTNELNLFEEKILVVLDAEKPVNIDEISNLTGINISDCLVNLLSLEFKGMINQLPGKNFVRNV